MSPVPGEAMKMSESFDELCQLAIKRWGVDSQIDMAIEEMAELIVQLEHYRRKRTNSVEEEIADVELAMGQLRIIFNASVIDVFRQQKIKRFEELLAATPPLEEAGE